MLSYIKPLGSQISLQYSPVLLWHFDCRFGSSEKHFYQNLAFSCIRLQLSWNEGKILNIVAHHLRILRHKKALSITSAGYDNSEVLTLLDSLETAGWTSALTEKCNQPWDACCL